MHRHLSLRHESGKWSDPIYDARPDPDFQRWVRDLYDAAYGPTNPQTGEPYGRGFCQTMRCKLLLASLAAIAAGIFGLSNVKATSDVQTSPTKSRILRGEAGQPSSR